MARRQSERPVEPLGRSPVALGRLAWRLGLLITTLAAPLAVLTGGHLLLSAPSVAVGLDTAIAAASGPLGAPAGVGWAFHVSVVALLAGTWLLGAGLVLSGLFD